MVFQTALRSLSNRSKVVVGNYCISPITAEPYREKTRPLRPRRSYFAPAKSHRSKGLGMGFGGGAGYRPRVRTAYFIACLSP